jgi:hypothetical protein
MTSVSSRSTRSTHASSGNEDARTMLEKVLETQRQIADCFIVKEPVIEYYGWFSEDVQMLRTVKPVECKLRRDGSKTMTIKSPPYTYWLQGNKKVLVTDVTLTPEVMKRHSESGAIFLGKLDKFCCRSYTKL